MNEFPLEIVDAIFGFSDIDTKLALRQVYPHFRFTYRKTNGIQIIDDVVLYTLYLKRKTRRQLESNVHFGILWLQSSTIGIPETIL